MQPVNLTFKILGCLSLIIVLVSTNNMEILTHFSCIMKDGLFAYSSYHRALSSSEGTVGTERLVLELTLYKIVFLFVNVFHVKLKIHEVF